jgi:hypothetical protein
MEIAWNFVSWIHVAEDRVQRGVVITVTNLRVPIKGGKILE